MKYTIIGTLTISCWTEVEAGTEKEALEIAETRGVSTIGYGALTSEVDEEFHFEGDGEPYDLVVE